MKSNVLSFPVRLLGSLTLAAGFFSTGCKKGEEAPVEEEAAPAPAAEAAAKPPPEVKVTLAKKWPAGNKLVFEKAVTVSRQPSGPTAIAVEQFRMTRYTAAFPGGTDESDGGQEGMAASPNAAAATLAGVVPVTIVGQKIRTTAGGNTVVDFDSDMGGEGGERDGGDEQDPSAGRPHPLGTSVASSVGSVVILTYDAAGAVTKVDGLQQVHGRVLRGIPRAMFALVGGMFSETTFREAMMFHGMLNGGEAKKGDTWVVNEKAMLMLNWQQDFSFTNTLTGMKEWNGKQVAEIQIAGGMSGSTEKPSKVAIDPGASFTGTALYSPEMGVVVEQSIKGNFVTQEGAAGTPLTVSNSFSRTFKVTQTLGAGEEFEMQQ